MKQKRTPEVCPVCDEDVPPNAKACPKCGACHESGWDEDGDDGEYHEVDYNVLDLPDHAYDSDEERREARRREGKRGALPSYWRWVALVVLVAVFLYFWKWLGW